MPAFVLVHGGAHGAWCWERLLPLLERDPRVTRAIAIDLPGHGSRLASKPQHEIQLAERSPTWRRAYRSACAASSTSRPRIPRSGSR